MGELANALVDLHRERLAWARTMYKIAAASLVVRDRFDDGQAGFDSEEIDRRIELYVHNRLARPKARSGRVRARRPRWPWSIRARRWLATLLPTVRG